MQTNLYFIIVSRLILLKIRIFQTKFCRENYNTHFVFKNILTKIVLFIR